VAVTGSASNIGVSSALVSGTVNPSGSLTAAVFEYGTTTSYGQSAAAQPNPGNGTSAVAVSATLSNLQPNTLYHFRLVASNSAGTDVGADGIFTTTGATGGPLPQDDVAFAFGDIAIRVLDNDGHTNPAKAGTLRVVSVTSASFGTATPNALNNAISYAPGSFFTTSDQFTYTVEDDGGETAQANVTVYAFSGLKATYAGFVTLAGNTSNPGFLQLTLSNSGSFTGVLRWEGGEYTLRGQFGPDGAVQVNKAKVNAPGAVLQLDLRLQPDTHQVLGQLADSSTVPATIADVLISGTVGRDDGVSRPKKGKFTTFIESGVSEPGAAGLPEGTGFMLVTVAKNGSGRFAGLMPDLEPVSTGSPLLRDVSGVQYKVIRKLYEKAGAGGNVAGSVPFNDIGGSAESLGADLGWLRNPDPISSYFPSGFSIGAKLFGPRFFPYQKGVVPGGFDPSLPTNGRMEMSGGGLVKPIVLDLKVTPFGVHVRGENLLRIKVKVSGKEGVFSGSFDFPIGGDPANGVEAGAERTRFHGALRNGSNQSRGLFRGPPESGQTGRVRMFPFSP
jgi:hypothetical protein